MPSFLDRQQSSDAPSVDLAKGIIERVLRRKLVFGRGNGAVDLVGLTSPTLGVEVKRFTSEHWRQAHAQKSLTKSWNPSEHLSGQWTLVVDASRTAPRFAAITKGAEPILARLEALGIADSKSWKVTADLPTDVWVRVVQSELPRLRSELGRLLGPPGGYARRSDNSLQKSPGYEVLLMQGHVSTTNSDTFADRLSSWLDSDGRVSKKLRHQLDRSQADLRHAFLEFDFSTGLGWSLDHIAGTIPSVPLELPDAIDAVWIAQRSVLVWFFDRSGGWQDLSRVLHSDARPT